MYNMRIFDCKGGYIMFGNFDNNFFGGTPIMSNNGTGISVSGNSIMTTDGKVYQLSGGILYGPNGTMSMNVKSMDEAVGIVTGLCGGKMF